MSVMEGCRGNIKEYQIKSNVICHMCRIEQVYLTVNNLITSP